MLLVPTIAFLAAQALSPDLTLDPDADVVVCKVETKTNTRFGTRTCHTRGEWKFIAEQNRRAVQERFGAGQAYNPCSADSDSCKPSRDTLSGQ
jgi:hypothetical protein